MLCLKRTGNYVELVKSGGGKVWVNLSNIASIEFFWGRAQRRTEVEHYFDFRLVSGDSTLHHVETARTVTKQQCIQRTLEDISQVEQSLEL